MSYFIATSEQRRADKWQRIFGVNHLPVMSSWPRPDLVNGREAPVYDLAISRLRQSQRDRLAAYKAKHTRRPYREVLAEINAAISLPIKASGCYVVEEEATARLSPLFVFAREQLAWAG
jgi:hypothetical protein